VRHIRKRGASFALLQDWSRSSADVLQAPMTCAVDDDDNVYAFCGNTSTFKKYSREGALLDEWSAPGTLMVYSMGYRGGRVYAGTGAGAILVFDTSGTIVDSWTTGLGTPVDSIAFEPAGDLAIASRNYQCIRYSPSGVVLGPKFTDAPWPCDSVAIDPLGRSLIFQRSARQVLVYAADGTYLRAVTGLVDPGSIAVDADGMLYVVERIPDDPAGDYFAPRIRVFNDQGLAVGIIADKGIAPGQMQSVGSIAFGTDGTLYAPDSTLGCVNVYAHTGEFGEPFVPTTSINANPIEPPNGWYTTPPDVTLTSNHAGSTYFKWGWWPGWSTYSGILTAPEGWYELYYYSADEFGNAETVAAPYLFRVDSIAPETASGVLPSYVDHADFNLYRTEIGSGVYGTYYRIDGEPEWHSGNVMTVTGAGQHTLEYYSVDIAGNSETPHTDTFEIVEPPRPANNLFANAQVITGAPNSISGTNVWPVSLMPEGHPSGTRGRRMKTESPPSTRLAASSTRSSVSLQVATSAL
jgi:hypothetical protein